MSDRIDLPADGTCPCGSKELLLAKDQTEYTPVSRVDGKWLPGASYTEQTESADALGGVRVFCTDCGQYFNVPEDLT
jgi:hypothetical protein